LQELCWGYLPQHDEAEESAEPSEYDTIAEVVADKQSGLQLLVIENCRIPDNFTVPQTVRYLYLDDRSVL